MQRMKSTLGPAGPGGYVQATGIQMTFGEFEKITKAQVKCDNEDILAVNDLIYSIRVSFTGTTVSAHIWYATTAGLGPNAWTELAGATVLNTRTFTFIAEGE